MSVDAKLFVTCKPQEANKVYASVKKALDKWQRNLLDSYWKQKAFESRLKFLFRDKNVGANKDLKDFSNGISSITTNDFGSFSINFVVNGENRSLFCTHSCGNDYSDTYVGEKIIFSIGCWGMSDEIMNVVGKACKEFGDVYYDFNDCDELDFVKI